jgi:hypothetical protein
MDTWVRSKGCDWGFQHEDEYFTRLLRRRIRSSPDLACVLRDRGIRRKADRGKELMCETIPHRWPWFKLSTYTPS